MKYLYDEVLKVHYHLFVGKEHKNMQEYASTTFGDNIDTSDITDSDGWCFYEEDRIYIWVPAIKSISIVIHEITHALLWIFEFRDIPISHENSEIFCYYMEWLTEKFLN